MSELGDLLVAAGIDPPAADRLAAYGEALLAANRQTNLTGAKNVEELAPHLIDSLTVIPFLQTPYVDVGSGAGLPAIPVALMTGMPATLIETTQKKARFLGEVAERFGLDVTVLAQRAEVAGHDPAQREQFASATARAVSSAPTVAELLLPLLRVGGAAVLQRGSIDDAERRALEDAVLVLGGQIEAEHPAGGERRIIVVRKIAATNVRFPRRVGIPEKRPLCT